MKVSKSAWSRRAFVLTTEELARLSKSFEDFGGGLEFEAKCSDGLNRHFDDFSEVAAYDNPPTRSIVALTIRTGSGEDSAFLHLGGSGSDNVWINIRGQAGGVVPLASAIDDRLAAIKPWYSWLAAGSELVTLAVFLVVSVGVGLLILYGLLTGGSLSEVISVERIIRGMGLGIGFVGLVFVLSLGLGGLRAFLFPRSVFAIGRGSNAHEHREWIRRLVVGGFAVSFIASLLVVLLS